MNPDGKGISALIGVSVAIFFTGAFIFGFPGVMAPYWQELFHVGRGAIGNILFFVLASVGICMFFVGRYQERIGIRVMVSIGAVMSGLDMFLLVLVSDLFGVYVWAFVMGTASCFLYLPAITIVQRWFPTRRGLVTGIVNFMFGVSAGVMAPVFGFLFERLGYSSMIVALGAVALVVGTIGAQFAVPPQAGEPVSEPDRGKPQPIQAALGRSLTVRESLRTHSFWFLWGTWALQGAAGISMVTLSTLFGLSKGFPMEASVLLLTGYNLGSGASRLFMGHISDVVGRNTAMSVTFLAAGLAYFGLAHIGNPTLGAALAAVIGFAFGTMTAVSAPLAVDCFGIEHFGAIFGVVFTAYGFVAGIIGPSLSGYVLDATQGNFTLVFGYLGAFCLVSAVLIRFVTPPRVIHARQPFST